MRSFWYYVLQSIDTDVFNVFDEAKIFLRRVMIPIGSTMYNGLMVLGCSTHNILIPLCLQFTTFKLIESIEKNVRAFKNLLVRPIKIIKIELI